MSAAVDASNLSKSFGRHQVLHHINTQVDPGDVVGVIGKNGAGKTTLLETLLGFSPPTSGTSRVFGEPSRQMSAATKSRIGFVPQQDELLATVDGRRQLALNGCFHERWDETLLQRLAREWEVPLDRRIGSLSGGERQKLSTLMALGNCPDLLVLDEPVASLDPLARRRFLQQLLEIAGDEQRAVIFSTHIVSDLERVANRIWMMRDGALVWDGAIDALKQSVKRLHISARQPLPQDLGVPRVLSCRRAAQGLQVTLTVRDPDEALLQELASRFDAQVETEGLGLEDIFLEVHA